MKYKPIDIARQFLFVHEAQSLGQNRGLRVEAIQHWAGGHEGDSWCMEFAWFVLDICFEGKPPFDRQQSTELMRQVADSHGWLTYTAGVGDLVLSLNANGHAHHVGIVTSTNPLTSIAGNTSANGLSSNGDRVAEHTISREAKIFVNYPRH